METAREHVLDQGWELHATSLGSSWARCKKCKGSVGMLGPNMGVVWEYMEHVLRVYGTCRECMGIVWVAHEVCMGSVWECIRTVWDFYGS